MVENGARVVLPIALKGTRLLLYKAGHGEPRASPLVTVKKKFISGALG